MQKGLSKETAVKWHQAAATPSLTPTGPPALLRAGNSTIMAMEKHMLSTEIKVALCSDGINAFRGVRLDRIQCRVRKSGTHKGRCSHARLP